MSTPIPQNVALKIVANYGNSNVLKNILFLAEGFTSSEEEFFNRSVHLMIKELLKTSPFDLLSDKLIFYSAFTPSSQSGITVRSYVNNKGRPNVPYEEYNPHDIYVRMIEKDSALGLEYTEQMELSAKKGDDELIPTLIASLRHPHEGALSAIPECWLSDGKDEGLVIVLVNDDYPRGLNSSEQGGFILLSLGSRSVFNLDITLEYIDHTPIPKTDGDLIAAAHILMHELGHSFQLGDEYIDPIRSMFITEEQIESWLNLVSRREITDGNAFPVFIKSNRSIKWLNEDLFPGSAKKVVPREVQDFMLKGGVLHSYNPGDITGISQFPTQQFWIENPAEKKYWVNHSNVIGLYEGGCYKEKDVFRPTGICKMRSTSARTNSYSVKLDNLPNGVVFDVILNGRIIYDERDPCNKRLIHWGKMSPHIRDHLKTMSEDNAYQQAIAGLFKLSNTPASNAALFYDFCYWCQYVIVQKIDPARLEVLAAKRYPRRDY